MSNPVDNYQKAFDKAQADLNLAIEMQKDVPKKIKEAIERLISYAQVGKQDAEWQARKDACTCP